MNTFEKPQQQYKDERIPSGDHTENVCLFWEHNAQSKTKQKKKMTNE
jgi:hypothetical protein